MERDNLYARLLAVMAACAGPSSSEEELSARITATLLQPRVYLPSTLSKLFSALPPPPPMTPHAFPITPSVLPTTALRRPRLGQLDATTPHQAAPTAHHQRSRTADVVLLSPAAPTSVNEDLKTTTVFQPLPATAVSASAQTPVGRSLDVPGDDLLLQNCAAFILTPEHEKMNAASRSFAANTDITPLTVNLDMCGGLESIVSPMASSGHTTPASATAVSVSEPPRPPPLNVSVSRKHQRAASTVTVASGAGFLSPYATARKKSQHSLQHLLQQAEVRRVLPTQPC
jgi:hypothetical protein